MLEIDGSFGEGGGQILRTSLALSLITGRPIRIFNIRAARTKPGLQRQHLTAVRAAAEIGKAELTGDAVHSSELVFRPGKLAGGDYRFDIGTAGSVTLVLQTVLPPLMFAAGPSQVTLLGGTHNPNAPPYEFLACSFLPLVERLGPRITASLDRPGFYPAGGGQVTFGIEPAREWSRLELPLRGEIRRRRARAIVAKLPREIAERELRVIGRELEWDEKFLEIEEWSSSRSPGNVLLVEIETAKVAEVVVGFGQRGVRAETVAEGAAREAREYLKADVPVGQHLADQLILPLALGSGGSFVTLKPTLHTTTNIEVVRMFLDVGISVSALDRQAWQITVDPR